MILVNLWKPCKPDHSQLFWFLKKQPNFQHSWSFLIFSAISSSKNLTEKTTCQKKLNILVQQCLLRTFPETSSSRWLAIPNFNPETRWSLVGWCWWTSIQGTQQKQPNLCCWCPQISQTFPTSSSCLRSIDERGLQLFCCSNWTWTSQSYSHRCIWPNWIRPFVQNRIRCYVGTKTTS